MRSKIFAIVFFLVVVLSTITPATAQFGSSSQVYVFSHQVDPFGQSILQVYTTRCVENYQMFLTLAKRADDGRVWIDQPGIIPIGLEPLAPGVMVRRGLNLKLSPGTYQLSVTNLSQYGNANRNVKSTPCASDLQHYQQVEGLIFTIGNSQAEAPADAPVIMAGDQFVAMKERVVRFGALFPNATRLIFSQEKVDGTVRYFIADEPATTDFQQVSYRLPDSFDGSLPVDLYAKDKSTDSSVSLQVLDRNPVRANFARTTNR